MYLEFVDGTQLECIRILGGPRTINGIERDCLSIETGMEKSISELASYFNDVNNMVHLYTRELAGNISPKQEIGEGYLYRIDIRSEERKVKHQPGLMVPETYETIRVVNIAQLTYEEYQSWKTGGYTPPSFVFHE